MKKYKFLSVTLIVALVIILVFFGSVIAYMFRQTEYKDNEFTPAEVSCEVGETFNGTEKTSIKVKNTGNVDAYLRVRFVSYWVDSAGNILAKPSEMPAISMAAGWIADADGTFFYQSPVAPNELTEELLSANVVLSAEGDALQVLEVFAEAIQSEPTDAVVQSWGVTLDASGNITVP